MGSSPTTTTSTTAAAPTSVTQPHIALAAFPFGTHAAPLFSLATSLGFLSPSSRFSFLSTNPSLTSTTSSLHHHHLLLPNISLIPISDGLACLPSSKAPTNIEARIGLFLKSFEESLREGLKAAEVATGRKVSCIVSDAFLWRAADVASEMGVKWVPVWTGGPQALSAHLHTDLIRETIGVGDEAIKAYGDKQLHFVPGLSDHRASDLQEGIIAGDLNSPFSTMLHQMAHRLISDSAAAAVVLNTIQGLDPTVDSYFTNKFTNYFPVGPFHLLNNSSETAQPTDSYGCLSWLDSQKPASVAYISLGTVATIPPEELTSLANGLEASNVSFIWSLNEKAQSLLPPGFIDRINETGRGKIVLWTPQNSVLGHAAVGVFVSHCGWNSVMESISAGVPIFCRPFFGDQLVNARSISHVWKFGCVLDGGIFTKEGVVRAFEEVFKGEEGRKMREKARELKDMANKALAQHGSSRENLKRLMEIVCGS